MAYFPYLRFLRLAGAAAAVSVLGLLAASDAAAQAVSTADQQIGPACIDIYGQKSAADVTAAAERYATKANAAKAAAGKKLEQAAKSRNDNERRLETELAAAKKEAADATTKLSAILTEQPGEAELKTMVDKDTAEVQRIAALEANLKTKQDELDQAKAGIKIDGQRALAANLEKEVADLRRQVAAADKTSVENRLKASSAKLERKTKEAPELRKKISALEAKEKRLSADLSRLKTDLAEAEAESRLATAVVVGLDQCAARRTAELDPKTAPLLQKLDGLVAQRVSLASQMDALAAKSRAVCGTAGTEPAASTAKIDALGAELDALQAKAAAQRSQYAATRARSELASKAMTDATAALGEISAIRGQVEQASLAACERARAVVSNPGAPDAQARLAEARAKQAEAEQGVARTGNVLNTVRAAHALAQSANAAVAAAPDFGGQLAALQTRLNALNATPGTLRGKANESTAAINAIEALKGPYDKVNREINAATNPFKVEQAGSDEKALPPALRSALHAYEARIAESNSAHGRAVNETSCAAAFDSAAVAVEQRLLTATTKLSTAELEIKVLGAPPAGTDHAPEIEAIFNTARAAGDVIAGIATQAVTCVAAADSQIKNQVNADASALEAKKKECAAAHGRATAVWSPAQKQATCVCEAGYSFTTDKSKCVNDADFASFANGECARRVKGGVSTNRNAKAQTYDCGCRSGSVLNSAGTACVDATTFNTQAAQQCDAQYKGSIPTNADPRTGSFQCACPADMARSQVLNRCITSAEAAQVAASQCAQQVPGSTAAPGSIARQGDGFTYKCQCGPGLSYSETHKRCLNQNEVAAVNSATCEQAAPNSHAQVNPATGLYECYCKPGFASVSGQCISLEAWRQQAANECLKFPGTVLSSFDTNTGNYTCNCTAGYAWNGAGCVAAQIDLSPLINGITGAVSGSRPSAKKNCHRNPQTGQQHCM